MSTSPTAPIHPITNPPREHFRLTWQTYQLPDGDFPATLKTVMGFRRSGQLVLHLDDAGHVRGAEWREKIPKSTRPAQNPLDTA